MTTATQTNPWQELIQTCILGSGRRQPNLRATGSLGKLIDEIEESSAGAAGSSPGPEEKILMALTATSVALRVGQTAITAANLPPPPAPCPEEIREQCRPYSITLLNHVLADQAKGSEPRRLRLIRDWLTFCRAADQRIVPETLPRLMDFAGDCAELHQLLADCGGNHFTWLVDLNKDWQDEYKTSLDSTPSEGELVERVELGFDRERLNAFTALRNLAPATALTCLAALWEKESYEQKLSLLKLLGGGLSMEDERFLEETALANGRKEVRLAAAGLLSRLPQSRLVARMQARAASFVAGGKKTTLEITLPSDFDKSMARDGIEESVTIDSRIGQKAGWLYQTVSMVDPDFWPKHSGLSAEAYLELVLASQEWSLPMVLGLLNAIALYGNERFQDCIIAHEEIHLTESQPGQNFLKTLPPEKLERLIAGKLPVWAQTDRRAAPRLDLWYYLELVDFQWSEAFSIALLRFIIKEIKEKVPVFGHTFYSNAANFGLRMHVGAGQYLDELNLAQEEIDTWTRNGLERFVDNFRLRCQMHKSFFEASENTETGIN